MSRLGNGGYKLAGSFGKLEVYQNAGAPTDGTSGTGKGVCDPNTFLVDTTNGNLYVNRGTLNSPTWKLFTRALG